VQGVVLRLIDEPAVANTKAIQVLVDPEPVMSAAQIALAEWLSTRNLVPIGAIIGLFLPPGLAQQADTLYEIRAATGAAQDQQTTSKIAQRLLDALHDRGALRGRQLDRLFAANEPTAQGAARIKPRQCCRQRRTTCSSAPRSWRRYLRCGGGGRQHRRPR
jgi:primosomal protein N'